MNLFGTAGLLSLAAVFGFLAKGIRRPDRVRDAAPVGVTANPLNPKIVSAREGQPDTWAGDNSDAMTQAESFVSEPWQTQAAPIAEADLPPAMAPLPPRTSRWNLPPLPTDAPATDLWSVSPPPPPADSAGAEIPAESERLVTPPDPIPPLLEVSVDPYAVAPPIAHADDRVPQVADAHAPTIPESRAEDIGAPLSDEVLPPLPGQPPPSDGDGMPWLTPVDELPSTSDLQAKLAADPEYQAKAGWVARLSDEPLDLAARRELAKTVVLLDDSETLAVLAEAYQTDPDLRATIFAALDYYRPRNARTLYVALLAGGDISDAELAIDRLIGYGYYDDIAPAFSLHDDGIAAYAALRLGEHVDLRSYLEEHHVPSPIAQTLLEPARQ